MALIDIIRQFFKYAPVDTNRIRERLPFVHLFGHEKTYGAPQPQDYERQVQAYKSWAYACAWKNATSVARNKLCLYKVVQSADGEEELTKISQHPFIDVITSVNPFSNRFELFTLTQIFLELTGNAYWWMPKNELGVPYMIWCIPAHWTKIIPSKEKFIDGYVVRVPGMGELVPFDEEDVVHFKFPSPFDLFYGTGPLFAAAYALDLNVQTKEWAINFFMNNAQPSGVLTTESSLNPDQYQRLKDRWNEKYKGSKNAGKIAILEAGLKYEQTGSNIRDARLELVTREVRDEILGMFGVPASKLGLVEDVNRANADANDYTYAKETIAPRLTLIEEKLNEKVIPIYDKGLICKFDNPVPEDKEFKLREREINIRSGVVTIDEEREKDGLKPFNLPETSKPLIPFNLVPAGEEPPDPTVEPAAEPKSIEKGKARGDAKWNIFARTTFPQEKAFAGTVKRYFEAQHSEVMRNLNNYRAVSNAVTKDLSAFILLNMKEQNAKLKTVSAPAVRKAYVSGLTLGMNDTNSSIDFNLFEPNILRAVEQRIDFFAERINRGTADLISEALTEGFQNGESINDVAKRIDGIFNFSEKFRSKRIAQTEVIGATNDGQVRAYDEAGVEKKEWISARDEKVRESHQIDGQVVPLHQSFTTGLGSKLQYPGDRSSSAPVEDIINCRCTVLPIVRS